ncbi:Sensor histidine kinase ResE [Streptomyces sp. RB17]|uniref:sensor histidine kinase n=1 Tax=Streptomyces sp. RB17 TaxID=2585197 RepID=UPI00130CD0E3|nr:HAMP domain-containing sensor histidine kinase [Streptomyces sp. RB17]MQY37011.1 Sensor histidine kinase ResE [Streptomyces sp. RB17]
MTCHHAGQQVLTSVADTGAGIAPDDLPYVFEPLYRAESSRNRATGGAGRGLAIAQRVVHAHAGTITATNTPEGARFTVVLPTAPPGRQAGVVQEP